MAGKAGLSNSAYESMLHNPVMPAHCVSKVSFAREVFSPLYSHCHAFRSALSSYYGLGKLTEHSKSYSCCWLLKCWAGLMLVLCSASSLYMHPDSVMYARAWIKQGMLQKSHRSKLYQGIHSFCFVFLFCFVLFCFVVQGYCSKSSCCQEFVSCSGRLPVGWLH